MELSDDFKKYLKGKSTREVNQILRTLLKNGKIKMSDFGEIYLEWQKVNTLDNESIKRYEQIKTLF